MIHMADSPLRWVRKERCHVTLTIIDAADEYACHLVHVTPLRPVGTHAELNHTHGRVGLAVNVSACTHNISNFTNYPLSV